ncbi:TatD family hydrolase [Opacimonas viscosa]|uniref:TatD family hydrolase n=1 Tax=Opacimonas viscosa TaxID=2961944 RepID=A0AA42BK68_9ALTE|nr:TatD family hydrolase [Opacimonas viscosa]MCP3427359.1 TatD family hydrolase [Opacimonas viscosa]
MFVDSHCHLDKLTDDAVELAQKIDFAATRGVEHMLCVAINVKDYPQMLSRVEHFTNVSVSCGVHPCYDEDMTDYDTLLEYGSSDKVVAIGETGLDYYHSQETIGVQKQSFIDHINVAAELDKPLIIHTRNAREDTINILKEHGKANTIGVLHCFTESLEMAEQALELGFYISISGIVTFKTATELQAVAKAIPLDRLLIETDSPWLAPVPYRGKPNQPGYVVEVGEFIAELRGISTAELAKATTENFYRLFKHVKRA